MNTAQAVKDMPRPGCNGASTRSAREFAGVRTGRATTALLDGIRVDYYGTPTPLNQVASRLGARRPDPGDPALGPERQLAKIEKAIQKSDLGLTPVNDGKVIRLTIPTLTEERRKQLAKTVGKLAEDARVAIRNVRREANDRLKAIAKDKKISEDEERRSTTEIQKTHRPVHRRRSTSSSRRRSRRSWSSDAAAWRSGPPRTPWRSTTPRCSRPIRQHPAASARRHHHGRQRAVGDPRGLPRVPATARA